MGLQAIYDFSKVLNNFQQHKKGFSNSIPVSCEELFLAFEKFYTEYEAYAIKILKRKTFSDRELADYVFDIKFRTLTQYKEFLRRSLYVAIKYLNHFKNKVDESNIQRYVESIHLMKIDLEALTAEIETNYLHTSKSVKLRSGRKFHKDVLDIFTVAKAFFFFDDAENLSNFYSFDIKPYSIFPLRQLIEMYGKEIIGLITVEDEHGNFSKKHLYCAWEFIKAETKNISTSRISIPFDIEIILKVQSWANRFVHTTIDAPYYVIFCAIEMMFPLVQTQIKGLKKGIKTFDGQLHSKVGFADIKIERYNSLKQSFTDYVNQTVKQPKKFKPVWKDQNHVRSYIVSL